MEFLNAFSHLDWAQVLHLTWQHITLVGIAVILAIVVGVPLGVLMTRFPTLAGPLQASATVLLTVPSIALFGLLLPFYSKFGQGLGPMPAITAVFLYSLLPIMRNTYLALTGVEPGIREAAKGIGMTFGQRLRMVELPIAVPVILAGVRTAVVMNIGVMTIAATIGAGGLAEFGVERQQQAEQRNRRHGQQHGGAGLQRASEGREAIGKHQPARRGQQQGEVGAWGLDRDAANAL